MLATGTILGGYRIDSFLAQGGMGVVYRATQVGLDRRVALKVIAPELARNDHFRQRFKRESRLAAQIEHPNVIPVYEAGESDGQLFIAMRFIDGTDLATETARRGGLEPRHAAGVIAQVGDALDAAHKRGLIHRDVKPANVLLSEGHAYLTDFGLVKDLANDDGRMTVTGQWVGTPDYTAPEQFMGENVDARADIYALGCVLFHTLTGRVPFPGDQAVAKMWAHSEEPPPRAGDLAPNIPPQLDAVIARAMAKKPAERFQSAGDLGRAAVAAAQGLRAPTEQYTVARGAAAPGGQAPRANEVQIRTNARGEEITAARQPTPTRESVPGRNRTLLVAAAAVLVLAVAGVAIALLTGGGDDPSPDPAPTTGGGDGPPGAPKVAQTIPIGGELRDLAAGNGRLWVLGRGGTIVKIDAQSGKQLSQTRPQNGGYDLAYGNAAVYASVRPPAPATEDVVLKLDPATDGVVAEAKLPGQALGMVVDNDVVVLALPSEGELRRLTPTDLTPIGKPTKVERGPWGLALGDDRLWVTEFGTEPKRTDEGGGLLSTFRPIDGFGSVPKLQFPPAGTNVGEKPWAVAYANRAVYVASPYNQVTRVDSRTIETTTARPDEIFTVSDVIADENGVYIGGSSVAEAGQSHVFVQRLDPLTLKPIGKAVDLGESVKGYGTVKLAFEGGFLWASARGNVFKLER